jgi:hypothetical protein
VHPQGDHSPRHALYPCSQGRFCALTRSLAGTDRATIEFSTEEFAADALKLNGITLISFEVLLLLLLAVLLLPHWLLL